MKLRTVFGLLLGMTTFAMPAAELEKPQLRLVLSPKIILPGVSVEKGQTPPKGPILKPVVGVYVENYGTVPVVIPTRTSAADGGVSASSYGGGIESHDYYVHFEKTSEGRKIQPSESSFAPVKLMPGEITSLVGWVSPTAYLETIPKDTLKKKFMFKVYEDLAAKFGWWSGEISAECEFQSPKLAP